MSVFLVVSLLVVAGLIAIGLYRVWAGPTVFDRLVAVALVSVNGVVVLVLLGVALERPVLLFDIALGFALLAFLLPITLGRYFEARLAREGTGEAPESIPSSSVPHGALADRGRELERRIAQRMQRQAVASREASLALGAEERRGRDERSDEPSPPATEPGGGPTLDDREGPR
jgi:multicomponent Na+:H+ antiporter subunit F